MPTRRFMQLDVFADRPLRGNPLAVVIDAEGIDSATMQAFARWTNLVETTFLLPPADPRASYRVRMFTPHKEIDFAGHPSVGSAHAALTCGLIEPHDGLLWQECRAGVLPIRVAEDHGHHQLLLRSPAAAVRESGADAHPLLRRALAGVASGRLAPALVDGGRRWWVVECADEAALRRWQPDHAAVGALGKATASMGICAFARSEASDYQLVVRALASGAGIAEDPASGAANGLLAAYLAQAEPHGPLARGYAVSQGREIGYDARLLVRIDDDGAVWVGGRTNTVIDGRLQWDANA